MESIIPEIFLRFAPDSSNVSPVEYVNSASAQTGDMFIPIIIMVLSFVVLSACIGYVIYKKFNSFGFAFSNGKVCKSKHQYGVPRKIKKLCFGKLSVLFFALLFISSVGFVLFNSVQKASADSEQKSKVILTAYVDEQSGSVKVDPYFITNSISNIPVIPNSVNVDVCAGEKFLTLLSNSNINLKAFDVVCYDGKPGKEFEPTMPTPLAKSASTKLEFNISDISLDTLKSLYTVEASFKIKIDCNKLQIAKSPEIKGFTYNGHEQTCCEENEFFSVKNNKKTDAGSYVAHFSLKYGYVWDEDGNMEDKNLTWTISPKLLEIQTGSMSIPTYNASPVVSETVEIKGVLEGESIFAKTTGEQIDVGSSENTYEIDWSKSLAKECNYQVEKEELGTLSVVSPASFWYECINLEKEYDGLPLIGSATLYGMQTKKTGETEVVSFTCPELTKPGQVDYLPEFDWENILTTAKKSNYVLDKEKFKNGLLRINATEMVKTENYKDVFTFDFNGNPFSVDIKSFIESKTFKTNPDKVYYSLNSNDLDDDAGSRSEDPIEVTDASETNIYWRAEKEDHFPLEGSYKIIINAKPINPQDQSTFDIQLPDITYTGSIVKAPVKIIDKGRIPQYELVLDEDYEIIEGNDSENVDGREIEVKIQGKGNYGGVSISLGTWKVIPKEYNPQTQNIIVDSLQFDYDGAPHDPEVKVYDKDIPISGGLNFKELQNNVDYVLEDDYTSKTNAGSYKFKVRGKGNYKFEIDSSWTIQQRNVKVNIVGNKKNYLFDESKPWDYYNVVGYKLEAVNPTENQYIDLNQMTPSTSDVKVWPQMQEGVAVKPGTYEISLKDIPWTYSATNNVKCEIVDYGKSYVSINTSSLEIELITDKSAADKVCIGDIINYKIRVKNIGGVKISAIEYIFPLANYTNGAPLIPDSCKNLEPEGERVIEGLSHTVVAGDFAPGYTLKEELIAYLHVGESPNPEAVQVEHETLLSDITIDKPELSDSRDYTGDTIKLAADGIMRINNIDYQTYIITGDVDKKSAGDYTAYVSVQPGFAWGNLPDKKQVITHNWTINKVELELKAKNLSITYGEAPQFIVEPSGLKGTDNLASAISGNVTCSCAYKQFDAVGDSKSGTFDITVELSGSSQNYNVKKTNGILSVSKSQINVIWANLTQTYVEGTDKYSPTVTLSGIFTNDNEHINDYVLKYKNAKQEDIETVTEAGQYITTLTIKDYLSKRYFIKDGDEKKDFTVQEKQKYSVTFNLNGHGTSTAPESLVVEQGNKITQPQNPLDSLGEYEFVAWYKDSNCSTGSVWNFENDVVNDNITLYAKWNLVKVRVTLDTTEGSISDDAKQYLTNNTIQKFYLDSTSNKLYTLVAKDTTLSAFNVLWNNLQTNYSSGSSKQLITPPSSGGIFEGWAANVSSFNSAIDVSAVFKHEIKFMVNGEGVLDSVDPLVFYSNKRPQVISSSDKIIKIKIDQSEYTRSVSTRGINDFIKWDINPGPANNVISSNTTISAVCTCTVKVDLKFGTFEGKSNQNDQKNIIDNWIKKSDYVYVKKVPPQSESDSASYIQGLINEWNAVKDVLKWENNQVTDWECNSTKLDCDIIITAIWSVAVNVDYKELSSNPTQNLDSRYVLGSITKSDSSNQNNFADTYAYGTKYQVGGSFNNVNYSDMDLIIYKEDKLICQYNAKYYNGGKYDKYKYSEFKGWEIDGRVVKGGESGVFYGSTQCHANFSAVMLTFEFRLYLNVSQDKKQYYRFDVEGKTPSGWEPIKENDKIFSYKKDFPIFTGSKEILGEWDNNNNLYSLFLSGFVWNSKNPWEGLQGSCAPVGDDYLWLSDAWTCPKAERDDNYVPKLVAIADAGNVNRCRLRFEYTTASDADYYTNYKERIVAMYPVTNSHIYKDPNNNDKLIYDLAPWLYYDEQSDMVKTKLDTSKTYYFQPFTKDMQCFPKLCDDWSSFKSYKDKSGNDVKFDGMAGFFTGLTIEDLPSWGSPYGNCLQQTLANGQIYDIQNMFEGATFLSPSKSLQELNPDSYKLDPSVSEHKVNKLFKNTTLPKHGDNTLLMQICSGFAPKAKEFQYLFANSNVFQIKADCNFGLLNDSQLKIQFCYFDGYNGAEEQTVTKTQKEIETWEGDTKVTKIIEIEDRVNAYKKHAYVDLNLATNTTCVASLENMFANCGDLNEIYFGGLEEGKFFSADGVVNFEHMFEGCGNLTKLVTGKENQSKSGSMQSYFGWHTSFRNLGLDVGTWAASDNLYNKSNPGHRVTDYDHVVTEIPLGSYSRVVNVLFDTNMPIQRDTEWTEGNWMLSYQYPSEDPTKWNSGFFDKISLSTSVGASYKIQGKNLLFCNKNNPEETDIIIKPQKIINSVGPVLADIPDTEWEQWISNVYGAQTEGKFDLNVQGKVTFKSQGIAQEKKPKAVVTKSSSQYGSECKLTLCYNSSNFYSAEKVYDLSDLITENDSNLSFDNGISGLPEWVHYDETADIFTNDIDATTINIDASFKQLEKSFSIAGWFAGMHNLLQVNNFGNMPNCITNCDYLFAQSGSEKYISNLDLSAFNSDNLTSAQYMFKDSKYLQNDDSVVAINLANDFGPKCLSMKGMFENCASSNVKISGNFGNKNTDCTNMFKNSAYLKRLDLSGKTTDSPSKAAGMFAGCFSLDSLSIGCNWDSTFEDCGLTGTWVDKSTNEVDLKTKITTNVYTQVPSINFVAVPGDIAYYKDKDGKKVDRVVVEPGTTIKDITYPGTSQEEATITLFSQSMGSRAYSVVLDDKFKTKYSFSGWNVRKGDVINRSTTICCLYNPVARDYPKLVVIGSKSNEVTIALAYDKNNYNSEANDQIQYEIEGTENQELPPWIKSANGTSYDWYTSIQNKKVDIQINSSFKNYTGYEDADGVFHDFTSCAYWFAGLNNVQYIMGLSNLYTQNITNAKCMFHCVASNTDNSSLWIDFGGLNNNGYNNKITFPQLEDGSQMLANTGFDTIIIGEYFFGKKKCNLNSCLSSCSNLKTLVFDGGLCGPGSDWTSAISSCTKLETLKFDGFNNSSNVVEWKDALKGCNNLKTLYFGSTFHQTTQNWGLSGLWGKLGDYQNSSQLNQLEPESGWYVPRVRVTFKFAYDYDGFTPGQRCYPPITNCWSFNNPFPGGMEGYSYSSLTLLLPKGTEYTNGEQSLHDKKCQLKIKDPTLEGSEAKYASVQWWINTQVDRIDDVWRSDGIYLDEGLSNNQQWGTLNNDTTLYVKMRNVYNGGSIWLNH